MSEHGDRRDIVCDGSMFGAVDRLLILAEKDHHDRYREYGTELDSKEHAGFALHVEEVIEVHVVGCREHDGCGIAYKGCCALKIGRYGDTDDHRDRIDLEFFADRKTYRCDHENGCDIIDKG